MFSSNAIVNTTGNGGAIYVGNTGGSVSITGSDFIENSAPVIYNEQLETGVSIDGSIIANGIGWNPSSSSGGE